jgi:hypothetical protein
MDIMTEQHIAAQEWICVTCGGHDRKSCGCASATAISREIRAAAEKHLERNERERQRLKAKRAVVANTPVGNVEESPEASAERRKEHYANEDAAQARKPGTTYMLPGVSGRVSRAEFLAAAPAMAADADADEAEFRTGTALFRILANSTPGQRWDWVKDLNWGICGTDFAAVREAVADLYKHLMNAGR